MGIGWWPWEGEKFCCCQDIVLTRRWQADQEENAARQMKVTERLLCSFFVRGFGDGPGSVTTPCGVVQLDVQPGYPGNSHHPFISSSTPSTSPLTSKDTKMLSQLQYSASSRTFFCPSRKVWRTNRTIQSSSNKPQSNLHQNLQYQQLQNQQSLHYYEGISPAFPSGMAVANHVSKSVSNRSNNVQFKPHLNTIVKSNLQFKTKTILKLSQLKRVSTFNKSGFVQTTQKRQYNTSTMTKMYFILIRRFIYDS